MINFLHLNASDVRWGASINAYRLHKGLLKNGEGSHILCGLKDLVSDESSSIMPGRFGYLPNALTGKFFNFVGLQSFGYPSSLFLKKSKWVNKFADVIILRNLHWWYISIGVLPWLATKIPLIWRLPDMWPLTGHCAYSYDCQRWETGCGKCPRLGEYPELYFDTTRFLWQRKQRIYQKLKGRLIFVSSSLWLKKKIETSPLTKDFRCELIPTAVDLSIFRVKSKNEVRKALGISSSEKAIMFSAFQLKEKRKGIGLLTEIMVNLAKKSKLPIQLLLVGKGTENILVPEGIKVKKMGFVQDDNLLADIYNAADIYLSLSKADNLPNALVEATACGLPIISLDSGGCREIVQDNVNGYLFKDYSLVSESVINLLQDSPKLKGFSVNARRIAEERFSMDKQVNSYVALAKEMLN